jgi:hypothetical protein
MQSTAAPITGAAVAVVLPGTSKERHVEDNPADGPIPEVIRTVSYNGRLITGEPVYHDDENVIVQYAEGGHAVVTAAQVIEYQRRR